MPCAWNNRAGGAADQAQCGRCRNGAPWEFDETNTPIAVEAFSSPAATGRGQGRPAGERQFGGPRADPRHAWYSQGPVVSRHRSRGNTEVARRITFTGTRPEQDAGATEHSGDGSRVGQKQTPG